MPRLRKLPPEEVAAIEHDCTVMDAALLATHGLTDEEADPAPPPGVPTHRPQPKIGDVVSLVAGGHGIVLRVRGATDGRWDAVELLTDGQHCWVRATEVGPVLGRPRGISRIDHPRHRTHGWFVRVYSGSRPRVMRLFSDRKYHGRGAALAAALAFHAAEEAKSGAS